MKTTALLFWLATLEISHGGQIADYYWQQSRTNALASSGALSPPKLPPTTHGITEIGIERTPCFGTCPVYVCIIRSDGTVRYRGEAHVERMGDWEAKIDPYRFHHLANFIAESGYVEMPDTFASNVTDGDTVFTSYVKNGRRKVFRNYASSGPSKLWALQELIDGLTIGASWRQVAPSTEKPHSQAVPRTGASHPAGESNLPSPGAGLRR
jgi:hypothetical protein